MSFLQDFASLISVFSSFGSMVFGFLVLRFPNKGRIHRLLSATLFLYSLTTLFRVLYWQTGIPLINQISYLGMCLLPFLTALFVEETSNQTYPIFQKLFFLIGSVVLFLVTLFPSILNWKPYLFSLLSFHLLTNLFYILLLRKGYHSTTNEKEKNIIICLLISFYSIFGLVFTDWLHKLGYIDIQLFPIGVSVFVFYLSMIIYSSGPMKWRRQTLKLAALLFLSLIISGVFLFHFGSLMKGDLANLSLAIFVILVNTYAIYNQVSPRGDMDPAFWHAYLLDSEDRVDLKSFLKDINRRPEFHSLSLVKRDFIKKVGCEAFLGSSLSKRTLIGRQDVQRVLQKISSNQSQVNAYQSALFLFSATESDYFLPIPFTPDFLCVKFIKIVDPDIHLHILHSLSQKLSLLEIKEDKIL